MKISQHYRNTFKKNFNTSFLIFILNTNIFKIVETTIFWVLGTHFQFLFNLLLLHLPQTQTAFFL